MWRKKRTDNLPPRNLLKVMLAFLAFIAIAAELYIGAKPRIPSLKEGEVSSVNIYAPFDFTITLEPSNTQDVKKGELVLAQGERAQVEDIAKLEYISKARPSLTARSLFGISLIVAISIFLLGLYLVIYEPRPYLQNKNILLISVLISLMIGIAHAGKMFGLSDYGMPNSWVPILIAMLINPRLAILTSVMLALVIGTITDKASGVAIVALIGGITGVYAIQGARRRNHIIKAGAVVGCVNFLAVFALNSIDNIPIKTAITNAGWGLGNGIISAFLAAGLLPFLEYAFRIVTSISLLELSDLNHPLLKEMVMKAPGTYHHSLVVGNLAEAACDAIGANSLLARVGSYYHDIGKIEKPEYFSENQSKGTSKHDKLTPSMSSLIITNHVKDGLELAKKYKLNSKIQDFIRQHHGSGLIFYFYQRALEEIEDEEKVQEEGFRYEGPKPQTKEAAVVLLADSVEAASRTLQDPTPARLRNLVHKIINNKFIDGQLDECDLTLKDLNAIASAFTHILSGIFHTRVNYPAPDEAEDAGL